jgi:hypothetical protein
VLVAFAGRLITSSADGNAIQHPIPEVQAILAKAAKLPLRDAAYMLWMEKSKLDKLERPEMTDEERAKARARSSEEVAAAIRYEHDHAQDGTTFDRLKLTHPQADTAEAKQAIIAGVKFNDACFKNFSHAPTDYDRRADHAIAVARNENPGYLPSTYRQARWWVTYLMK